MPLLCSSGIAHRATLVVTCSEQSGEMTCYQTSTGESGAARAGSRSQPMWKDVIGTTASAMVSRDPPKVLGSYLDNGGGRDPMLQTRIAATTVGFAVVDCPPAAGVGSAGANGAAAIRAVRITAAGDVFIRDICDVRGLLAGSFPTGSAALRWLGVCTPRRRVASSPAPAANKGTDTEGGNVNCRT